MWTAANFIIEGCMRPWQLQAVHRCLIHTLVCR